MIKWCIALLLSLCCLDLNAWQTGDELEAEAIRAIRAREYESGIQYYQQAAEYYLNKADTLNHYRVRIFSSYALYRSGATEESISDILNLVEQVKGLKGGNLPFTALARLSMLYREDNRLIEAEEYLRQAFDSFELSESEDSYKALAKSYTEAGQYLASGDFDAESRYYFMKADDLYDSLGGNGLERAGSLYNLFNINFEMGFFYEAGQYLDKSTRLKWSILNDPDHPQMAINYLSMGMLALNQMRREQAVTYLERALVISRKESSDNRLIPFVLGYLSDALVAVEDLDKALKYSQEALEFNKLKYGEENNSVALSHQELGHLYNGKGQYKKAIEEYRKALRIFKVFEQEFARSTIPRTQVFLGLNLMIDGAYQEGSKVLHEGLSVLRKYEGVNGADITKDYRAIADQFYENLQEYDSALHYYQYALHSRKFDFKSADIRVNPTVNSYKDYESLFPILLGKARSFFKRYEEKNDVADALSALSTLKKLDSVAVDFKSSSRVFSDVFALQSTLSEVNTMGFGLSNSLYQRTEKAEYLESAFRFSEKNKSNLILSKISSNHDLIPGPAMDKVADFAANISYLESQRFKAQSQKDTVRAGMVEKELFEARLNEDVYLKELQTDYPAYFQNLYIRETTNLSEAQSQSAREQALLLSYHFHKGKLYLQVIGDSSTELLIIPEKDSVAEKVFHYNTLIQNPAAKPSEEQTFEALAQSLAEMLLPSGDVLSAYKKIRISWDNALPSIPFESLRINGEYLISSHEVVYTNSLTINDMQLSMPLAKKQRVLAFAPVFDTEGLLNALNIDSLRDGVGILKWSSEEVKSIEDNFEVNHFIGESATEIKFRELSPYHSIIHVATHGLQNLDQPAYSRLLFSKQNTDSINDGNLYMREIFQLDIPADMVVLSACHSGSGQYMSGEGLMSLANSFMYAGTKSVVMTLWTANDRSTSRIMQGFYGHLAEGQTKSSALRNAQLDYLENHKGILAHPYYWAHFVVNGDDRPLVRQRRHFGYWLLAGVFFLIILISLKRIRAVKK
ncbi:MAG: hypothetical protein Roseis2KO_31050 [Roseivirga sp.]